MRYYFEKVCFFLKKADLYFILITTKQERIFYIWDILRLSGRNPRGG